MKYFLYIVIVLFAVSCKPGAKENTKNSEKTVQEVQNKTVQYPTLDQATRLQLHNECDYIDFILHTLPFSISQDKIAAIKTTIDFISPEGVSAFPQDCQPMARQIFQVKGEIVLEADVYFSDNCRYFVFYKDDKPFCANMMNPTGINFFANLANSVSK